MASPQCTPKKSETSAHSVNLPCCDSPAVERKLMPGHISYPRLEELPIRFLPSRFLVEERALPLVTDFLVIHDLLRTADKQHPAGGQRLVIFCKHLVLCLLRKID